MGGFRGLFGLELPAELFRRNHCIKAKLTQFCLWQTRLEHPSLCPLVVLVTTQLPITSFFKNYLEIRVLRPHNSQTFSGWQLVVGWWWW